MAEASGPRRPLRCDHHMLKGIELGLGAAGHTIGERPEVDGSGRRGQHRLAVETTTVLVEI